MSSGELDRQQIRRAVRQMGDKYIFYLLDDAISLLSEPQLRQLIAPYTNPEQFIQNGAPQENLLGDVLAFQKASLAGEYYDETNIASQSLENSVATLSWIVDFRRLLDRCAAEADSTDPADLCTAFDVLFGLLDKLDAGESIAFAEESGSWMIGVDWKTVLPPWFRALVVTTDPAVYVRRIEAIIGRHCHEEQAEMQAIARNIQFSMQQRMAPEG